jgi:hypothetical protein
VFGFAGAKALLNPMPGSARLKSCPDTNRFLETDPARPGTYSTKLRSPSSKKPPFDTAEQAAEKVEKADPSRTEVRSG